MVTKQKQKHLEKSLVRPDRRGTIIMGSGRCGSHFVEALCRDQCHTMELQCNGLGEYIWTDKHDCTLQTLISQCEDDDRYHTMVLNHPQHKLELSMLATAREWLTVRVTRKDKHRWYISNFFHSHMNSPSVMVAKSSIPARYKGKPVIYQGNSDIGRYYDKDNNQYIASWNRDRGDYIESALVDTNMSIYHEDDGHHGMPSEVYHDMLDRYTHQNDTFRHHIGNLSWHMSNHIIGQMIPVDLELCYEDLPNLANDRVQWKPNDYPDRDVTSGSKHSAMIKKMLDLWPNIPGQFRETQ